MPLVLVIVYILSKGLGALSGEFFTTDPTGNFLGAKGGIKSAILGTIEIVGFAALVAVPLGIGVAVYLTEFGANGRLAQAVRFFVDVMTGVPSIVFGLFIYLTLVLAGIGGSSFAGWKGSAALALLMLPVVTRSAEVVLKLVPESLREAAWRSAPRAGRYPPGRPADRRLGDRHRRAARDRPRRRGDRAAALHGDYRQGDHLRPDEPMNSLPAQIFQDLKQPDDELVQRAWGAALTLVALILIVTLVAKLIQRRSRVKGAA